MKLCFLQLKPTSKGMLPEPFQGHVAPLCVCWIQQVIQDGIISVQQCPCALQIPDIRTKSFPPVPFEYFKDQLPATSTLAADCACLSVQISKLLSVPIPTPSSVQKDKPLVIRKLHNSNHSHIDKPRKACAPHCKYIQSNILLGGEVDNPNLGNLKDKAQGLLVINKHLCHHDSGRCRLWLASVTLGVDRDYSGGYWAEIEDLLLLHLLEKKTKVRNNGTLKDRVSQRTWRSSVTRPC